MLKDFRKNELLSVENLPVFYKALFSRDLENLIREEEFMRKTLKVSKLYDECFDQLKQSHI
jgi:hypothetical protein